MATKRLATAAILRGVRARAAVSAAPLSPLSQTSASRLTLRIQARQQLPRSAVFGRAWYSSEEAPQGQFWDFEKLNAAIQSSTPHVTLIDVREPDEIRKTGRIPGALNVPVMSQPDSFHLSAEEFRDRFGFERPSDADAGEGQGQIVFYCKAGVRSQAAFEIARLAGWNNVAEYPGSWTDWVAQGGDVEKEGKVTKGKGAEVSAEKGAEEGEKEREK
ncbi:Rhodanese-like protein [Rostrohypoxylon terebratum]|nr:Rhodanese-like protein [Rostrohypoxylon terebratum]